MHNMQEGKFDSQTLEKVYMFQLVSLIEKYRKRSCISRTFFHKMEAKNQGCGLSMDTAVSGVLKNLINILKTSHDVKK